MTYTLRLSWPPAALRSNARPHWAQRHRATAAYRREAWAECKRWGAKGAVLEFTFHPPDSRRRDAQNMPGAVKAAIDGIADAMGRDDAGFRCMFPAAFAAPVKGGAVVVRIRPGVADVELRGAVS